MLKKNYLVNLVFFFSFFPFIKFIPWIRAEVQPISAIFASIFILLFGIKRDRITMICILFTMCIISYSFISIVRGINIFEIFMLMLAYMLPLVIFLCLRENLHLLSKKTYSAILIIYLSIGLLQYFGLFHFGKHFLEMFIPRASVEQLGGGARGVTFLSPEPSYGGMLILLVILTGICLYLLNKISIFYLYIVFIASTIMLLMNKSATGFFLVLIFLMTYFISKFLFKSIVYKFLFFLFLCIFLVLFFNNIDYLIKTYSSKVRFIAIFGIIKNIIVSKNFFSYYALSLLTAERLLTVIVGYISLFDGFGLGHGIASYLIDSNRLSEFAGVYWPEYRHLGEDQMYAEIIKPGAYGAQVAMDMGIIGLLILFLLVFSIWRSVDLSCLKNFKNGNFICIALFIIGVFMVFFYSTTALPVPWVILAYFYYLGTSFSGDISRMKSGCKNATKGY